MILGVTLLAMMLSCSKQENCVKLKLIGIKEDVLLNKTPYQNNMGELFNCVEWDTLLIEGPYYTDIYIPNHFEFDAYKSSDGEKFSYLFFYKEGRKTGSLKLEHETIYFVDLKTRGNRKFRFFVKKDSIRIFKSENKFLDGSPMIVAE